MMENKYFKVGKLYKIKNWNILESTFSSGPPRKIKVHDCVIPLSQFNRGHGLHVQFLHKDVIFFLYFSKDTIRFETQDGKQKIFYTLTTQPDRNILLLKEI